RCLSDAVGGTAGNETIFSSRQTGHHITATYRGGDIVDGSLAATADDEGNLNIRYQHIDSSGQFLTGHGFSRPRVSDNGKIRLYVEWQWTCGDYRKGVSVLEEM